MTNLTMLGIWTASALFVAGGVVALSIFAL